jgi:membrane protein implicated in regulation of membrane protease activity
VLIFILYLITIFEFLFATVYFLIVVIHLILHLLKMERLCFLLFNYWCVDLILLSILLCLTVIVSIKLANTDYESDNSEQHEKKQLFDNKTSKLIFLRKKKGKRHKRRSSYSKKDK